MGRIIITNDRDVYRKALQHNIKAGFCKYNEFNSPNLNIYACFHKKRLIDNENYYELNKNGFVASIGTLIYNNKFGIEALKGIYSDFNEDIQKIQEKLIGNYAIVIRKFNKIFIFTDKYEIFKIYYFSKKKRWFVSNTLSNFIEVLDFYKNNIVNEFGLIQESFSAGCVGNDTIFKEVYQLLGIEYIEINEDLSFKIKNIPYKRAYFDTKDLKLEDIIDYYYVLVKDKFSIVHKIFHNNIRIHLTGGVDSRTVLAGFMNVGCTPSISFGIGDSFFSYFLEEDLNIHKEIANKLNLKSYLMNWKNNFFKNIQIVDSLFDRYGFNYRFYGFNKNFFDGYEGLYKFSYSSPLFLEAGYFGENLRLREWATLNIKNMFTINEFIENYQIHEPMLNINIYPRIAEYKDYLKEKFIQLANIYNIPRINKECFNVDQFDELRQLSARHSDSYFVNLLNEFTYSISMFSTTELYEYPFNIPAHHRKDSKFQILLIQRLYPALLDNLSFLSHTHRIRLNYNLSLSELKDIKQSLKAKLIGIINNIDFLYKFYEIYRQKKEKDSEYNKVKEYLIKKLNYLDDGKNKILHPEKYNYSMLYPLIYYFSYLRAVRKECYHDSIKT